MFAAMLMFEVAVWMLTLALLSADGTPFETAVFAAIASIIALLDGSFLVLRHIITTALVQQESQFVELAELLHSPRLSEYRDVLTEGRTIAAKARESLPRYSVSATVRLLLSMGVFILRLNS
jgi:hypothetical protein